MSLTRSSASPLTPELPLGELGGDLVSLPVIPKERYDLRIIRALRKIIRGVDQHSTRLAQRDGVTVPQLLCLLKIDECGSMTVKDLAEAVFLSASTVVGIVDRLEKRGYFARERSVRDRRQVRIHLTDAGRALIARTPSPLQDALVRSIEALPELERATLALSFERVLELMHLPDEAPMAPILESRANLRDDSDVMSGGSAERTPTA